MIFRQKAMLRTAIRPKRKVVAGRTLRNGVARRGYRGVPVDDFRASFPLSGMTLSVVLGRTPWRAVRESYTDCREYMPLPPFVSPRPAEDVPAGCRSSAAAETAYFLTESGCESVGNIPTFSSGISYKKIFTTFCHQKVVPKVSARRKAAGNSQRLAKTGACRGFASKPAPFFNARRCSFLFPHFSQGGDCCALRATMIYYDSNSSILSFSRPRPARSHCENSGSRDVIGASARSDRAKSEVFRDRSASAGVVTRYFSPCLIFWCFWIKPKAQEKNL